SRLAGKPRRAPVSQPRTAAVPARRSRSRTSQEQAPPFLAAVVGQDAPEVDLPRAPALIRSMPIGWARDIAVDVHVDAIVQIHDQCGEEGLELAAIGRRHDREAQVHPEAVIVPAFDTIAVDSSKRAGTGSQILHVAAAVLWRGKARIERWQWPKRRVFEPGGKIGSGR